MTVMRSAASVTVVFDATLMARFLKLPCGGVAALSVVPLRFKPAPSASPPRFPTPAAPASAGPEANERAGTGTVPFGSAPDEFFRMNSPAALKYVNSYGVPATIAPLGMLTPVAERIGFAASPSTASVGDAPDATFGTMVNSALSMWARLSKT